MGFIWHIRLLGAFTAERAGQPLPRIRSQKAAALLAYLALFPRRPHTRDSLADLLWPDADGESARVNLRTVLSALRRDLEPPGVLPGSVVVTAGHTGVALSPGAIETDVSRFDQLIQTARRPSAPPAEQAQQLTEAVDVYTGPLLPDLDDSWVLTERTRLAEAHLQALRDLTTFKERDGDLNAALALTRRAVESHPFSEDAHSDVIRLQGRLEDRAGALRQFQELERRLSSLGLTPSTRTRALLDSVKEGKRIENPPEFSAARPAASPHASPSVPPSVAGVAQTPLPSLLEPATPAISGVHMPPVFTPFFGREKEMADLTAWLRETSPARLITLTGPGGSGKTRLSIETARRLAEHFTGGIWFVPLADLRAPEQIATAISLALGLPQTSAAQPLDQVISALNNLPSANAATGNAPVLLILDNFEQLVDAETGGKTGPGIIQTLLNRAPRLSCLVSSRQKLLLEAEQEYPLLPLPTPPQSAPPKQLMTFSSVQLWVSRAQAAAPGFQLEPQNAAPVAELCRRLEGIPLALDLAASWSRVLTPQQILDRLDRRFDLLVTRRRDAPSRHATLRATIGWSYDLLPANLKVFFEKLSVFRGDFSLDAAEYVCQEPNTLMLLADLRDHSLLVTEAVSSEMVQGRFAAQMRYRMLETIREFAQELQTKWNDAERAALYDRHADFFVKKAEEAEPHLRGSREQEFWLDLLEKEQPNFTGALEWTGSVAVSDSAGISAASVPHLRLCAALWEFWYLRGHLSMAERWLLKNKTIDQLFRLFSETHASPPDIPPAIAAKAIFGRGDLAHILNEPDTFTDSLVAARELYRQAGDKSSEGRTLARLAHRTDRWSYWERRQMTRVARRLCRNAGDSWAEAEVLTDQANLVHRIRRNAERAHRMMQRAADLYRAAGDDAHLIGALRERGTWYAWERNSVRANELMGEALDLARRTDSTRETAYLLWSIGSLAAFDEEIDRAIALLHEGVQLARILGDSFCLTLNLVQYAAALLAQGNDDAAQAAFVEGLSVSRQNCETKRLALVELPWCFEGLAVLAFQTDDLPRAARLLGVAWALGRSGPSDSPPLLPPGFAARYTALRNALRDSSGDFDPDWQWGRTVTASHADKFALQIP